MWRHEDIFFGALGGGGRRRRADHDARGDRRALPASRAPRCVPACPFMHGTAHWMAFSTLFTGGTVVISPERHLDPLTLWRARSSASRSNFLVIVGDAFARPLSTRSTRARPRRSTSRRCTVVLSGGAILSPSVKRALRRAAARRAARRRLRRVGDRRPGPVGRGRGRRRSRPRRASAVNDETTVLDDDLRPVAAGRRRPARPPRPRPARLLQGPGEDRGDVPGRRRRALGGARRPRPHRGRRHDHRCSGAARCRSTPAARRCTPKRSSRR